ncbi:MAG: ABC transporter permease [Lachnospiraceae bacterium]|nr:ABC transporter permease [Lachnospiraceae bacterium]
MFNLIINEFSKIFHKVSTYVLLGFLLFTIILMPVITIMGNVIMDKATSQIDVSTDTYDTQIGWATESNDILTVEMLTKAKELSIPEKEYFSSKDTSWRSIALQKIYYEFNYNEAAGKENYELNTFCNSLFDSIKKDDPASFYSAIKDNLKLIYDDKNLIDMYSFIYKYRVDNKIWEGKDNWQNEAISQYESVYPKYAENIETNNISSSNNSSVMDSGEFEEISNMALVSKYRLENNQEYAIYLTDGSGSILSSDKYYYSGSLYNTLKNSKLVLSVVLIIIIVVAGNIISKEFSQGTIKFLLINPVSRAKIFWSKFLTVSLYSLALTLLTFLLSFIISVPLLGFRQLNTALLLVEGEKVVRHSALMFILTKYVYGYIQIFIALTLAFTISSLFRNSALAITISIIFYYVGSSICSIAQILNFDFCRYTIFAVTDFESIMNKSIDFIGMTPMFGAMVLLIHTGIFLLIGYDSFTRKNI